jgi:hypothetical protein
VDLGQAAGTDGELPRAPATGRTWMTTGQLYYYLKLMGKDVCTRDLWEA